VGSNLVSEMAEILVGSCRQANVQRICSSLEGKARYSITESWEAFELESKKRLYSLHLTDLHFSDCFESVAFDNICHLDISLPTMVVLDNMGNYCIYRNRSSHIIEIYPEKIIDDEHFFSILIAIQTKYKYLAEFL